MRVEVLVAEIGSTVTKVHAFSDLSTDYPRHLGSGAAPTTVDEGDVTIGLRRAVADLEKTLREDLAWDRMMAASSAAGGLRMTVHGLVHDMTARAAREAALGAGAIVDLVTSGKLAPEDGEAVRRLRPGIILLAGGVEDGDREVVVHNAKVIASLGLGAPVVYAGNRAARAEAASALEAAGLRVTVVPNVYPRLDRLDVEPARRAIQDVFEEHIVSAPGMERVRDMVGGTIRPTPGAVMEAARVLRQVIGDLVVLDVGGATTDVHSVTGGSPEIERIQLHPEPEAKRTVEGDLGVFVNAANVVRLAGAETIARLTAALLPDGRLPGGGRGEGEPLAADGQAADGLAAAGVEALLADLTPLPPERMDALTLAFVEALARVAARTAVSRHAGRLIHLFGPTGRVTVAEGKDLTRVEWVVGTGGPLSRFPRALETLASSIEPSSSRPEVGGWPLTPRRGARPLIDRGYVLAVLGVLHADYPEAATRLLSSRFSEETGRPWRAVRREFGWSEGVISDVPRPSGSPDSANAEG